MPVYLLEGGKPLSCMRVVSHQRPGQVVCERRARHRCEDLELCDEHAAEWLANSRAKGWGQSELKLPAPESK